MSMSPAHFQRVFSAWVGISPKRYQQYLALDHAKALLREQAGGAGGGARGGAVRAVAAARPLRALGGDDAGELSPAEGEGLVIRAGVFETPFGPAVAMGTEHGLCGLGFRGRAGRRRRCAPTCARAGRGRRFVEDAGALRPWVEAAFGGEGGAAPPDRARRSRSRSGRRCWPIPSGQVATYGEIAAAIGHPKAVRAVGTAVGRNPVSWLIPCHRALRTTGGARRLSLGPAGQAGDAGLGGGALRRRGLKEAISPIRSRAKKRSRDNKKPH